MMRLAPTRYKGSLRPRSAGDVNAFLHSAIGGFPSLSSPFDFDSMFRSASPSLPVEVVENEENFVARIEVPGVKRDAIEIGIDGRTLRIEVFAASDADMADGARVPGRERSLIVPESVKTDEVKASLEDGILTLTLPKAEAARPRVIAIE